MPGQARRLARWSFYILRSARSFRGGPHDDLVQEGWVSAAARGDTEGVRSAQAAHMAAERSAR